MQRVLLPLTAFLIFTTIAFAQPDGPALNAETVLREIETLEKKQKDTATQAKNAAANILRPATAGGSAATALYMKAIEATRFTGEDFRASDFTEWRKKNEDVLKSQQMQNAIALNARYLLLSMDRAQTDDAEAMAPASLDYAVQLAKFLGARESTDKLPNELKDLLDKPASDGIFARWLRLGPWLPKGGTWESNPGNLAGILEKNVREPWRKAGNPKLIETWEFQMQFEAGAVTSNRLAHAADNFNTIRRPSLQFSRANDLASLGMKNKAASEILLLARTYPQHPEFERWVARIRELLAAPTAPATQPDAAPPAADEPDPAG